MSNRSLSYYVPKSRIRRADGSITIVPNWALAPWTQPRLRLNRWLTQVRNFSITHKYASNPAGLSFDFYGSADYYPIVSLFNGFLDGEADYKTGEIAKIPQQSQLDEWIAAALDYKKTVSDRSFSQTSNQSPSANPQNFIRI